jgi:hypothetical protein
MKEGTMHSRFSLRIAIGVIALLGMLAVPVLAHHGWAGNSDKEFEITGTVQKSVSLAGPHATMKIMANGQAWDLTLAPPPRTEAAGLKEGTIPVGATVTVHGHRNLDPKKFEIKTERITWNGKTFDVYPDRK